MDNEKKLFFVTETDSVEADDWRTQRAVNAEEAAEFFAEALNLIRSSEDDTGHDFDVSVKSEDRSIKRFIVSAQMQWFYSAVERPFLKENGHE